MIVIGISFIFFIFSLIASSICSSSVSFEILCVFNFTSAFSASFNSPVLSWIEFSNSDCFLSSWTIFSSRSLISSSTCSFWNNGFRWSTLESHTGHFPSLNSSLLANSLCSSKWILFFSYSSKSFITVRNSTLSLEISLTISSFLLAIEKQPLHSLTFLSSSITSFWIFFIASFAYDTNSSFWFSNSVNCNSFALSFSISCSIWDISTSVVFFSCSNFSIFGFEFKISFSNSFILFCNNSICVSSKPCFFCVFFLNSFRTSFIDSTATSNLSMPIIVFNNSLNSFGFALIIELSSPCWTIDAIFNFS